MMRLRTAVTPFFTARIVTLSVAVITATSSDLRLGAQSPAPDRRTPAFEVASVKLHASSDQQVSMVGEASGRFTARNIPLRLLIRTAFAVQDDQIVGGPAWIGSDRFDIVAKAEDGAPPSEVGLRLQSLLTERFKLAIHRETRELPVYALVAARHDGTVGPRMRPNDGVPGKTDAAASGAPRCGSISNGCGRLTLSASPMSVIALFLSPVVSRVVIDRSGVMGTVGVVV